MKAKLVEHIDWTDKWISDKKDPFEKAREYDIKKDLNEELLKILTKYRDKLKAETIL